MQPAKLSESLTTTSCALTASGSEISNDSQNSPVKTVGTLDRHAMLINNFQTLHHIKDLESFVAPELMQQHEKTKNNFETAITSHIETYQKDSVALPYLEIIAMRNNLLRYLGYVIEYREAPRCNPYFSNYVSSVLANRIQAFNNLSIVETIRNRYPKLQLLGKYEDIKNMSVVGQRKFYENLIEQRKLSPQTDTKDSEILSQMFSFPPQEPDTNLKYDHIYLAYQRSRPIWLCNAEAN